MPSERPDRSEVDCQPARTRLPSAPVTSSVEKANSEVENGRSKSLDNPTLCSTAENLTISTTAPAESSIPPNVSHRVESSSDGAAQPRQRELKAIENPTIKPESDSSESFRSAKYPAINVDATRKATVKLEQNSDATVATQSPQEVKEISLTKLSSVAHSDELAVLEAGVTAARTILDQLRIPMADFKQNKEFLDWLTLIDNLKAQTKTTGRTVVAVAGGTGAGKSSLINAVLNEEKLLPTNGMRAWYVYYHPRQSLK